MPVNEPPVQALSPDAQEAAYSGRNHQQLGAVDGPKPEVNDKPGWLERLEKAKESRGNVTLIDGEEYRIGKMLGKGAFGVVFEGDKLLTEGRLAVAIKFEPRRSDNPQLRDEYRVYKTLSGSGQQPMDGIPRAHYFGPSGLHNALVIDLLGCSLEGLFQESKRKFTLKTVAMLAKRMLDVVQLVHATGIMHRDLKPENFLMGRPGTPAANKVHLIDFGMAKRYQDPKTQKHIPYCGKRPLLGTARYMSINTHLGQEQSRRDDLETLCHMWVYFLSGSLPWQGMKASTNRKKYTRIGEKKQQTTIDDLCAGFPEEFARCLRYVRGLGFEDQPDYDHLQNLLSRVLENAGEVDDGEFDWMKVGEERLRELEIRPPPGPVGGNAAPPTAPTAMMTGKRPRQDSVPDPRQTRARRLPALLGSDPGLERAANIEEGSGIADQVQSGDVVARSRG